MKWLIIKLQDVNLTGLDLDMWAIIILDSNEYNVVSGHHVRSTFALYGIGCVSEIWKFDKCENGICIGFSFLTPSFT